MLDFLAFTTVCDTPTPLLVGFDEGGLPPWMTTNKTYQKAEQLECVNVQLSTGSVSIKSVWGKQRESTTRTFARQIKSWLNKSENG